MSLKNLKFNSETISTPGGDFTVRGLGLDDIKFLLRENMQQMKVVFDEGSKIAAASKNGDVDYIAFAASMIHIAPDVITGAIACACDEADADGIMAAKRLSMSVQIDAIDKIGRLTFETEGGPKKVFEIVMRMIQNAQGVLPNGSLSQNGFGGSAGK